MKIHVSKRKYDDKYTAWVSLAISEDGERKQVCVAVDENKETCIAHAKAQMKARKTPL